MMNRSFAGGSLRHAWVLGALLPMASLADLPVEVGPGECPLCDQFPVATKEGGEVVLRMTAAFTAGGWVPEGFVVKDPPDGVQEANGAWRADLITIQHAYAASIDLDLDRLANAFSGTGETASQPRAAEDVFSSEVFEATDKQIDKLVCELYGLSKDEIAIVEQATM